MVAKTSGLCGSLDSDCYRERRLAGTRRPIQEDTARSFNSKPRELVPSRKGVNNQSVKRALDVVDFDQIIPLDPAELRRLSAVTQKRRPHLPQRSLQILFVHTLVQTAVSRLRLVTEMTRLFVRLRACGGRRRCQQSQTDRLRQHKLEIARRVPMSTSSQTIGLFSRFVM